MEASSAMLYRALGKPVSEQYDIAYRRLRWACGCVAFGRTSQGLLLTRCLRHRRMPLERTNGPR